MIITRECIEWYDHKFNGAEVKYGTRRGIQCTQKGCNAVLWDISVKQLNVSTRYWIGRASKPPSLRKKKWTRPHFH